MIPAVLAEPVPPPRRPGERLGLPGVLLAGMALVVAGTVATLVWAAAVSPYGFARFALADADRTLTVRDPGVYIVFEEFPGATGDAPTLPVDVSVLDSRGRPLAVTVVLDPADPRGTASYQLPWREGRAIAEFEVRTGGTYLVRVTPRAPGTYASDLYRIRPSADIAIGREISTSWLGSPLVALVAGLLPFTVGLVMVVVGVRRWREPSPAITEASPAVPIGAEDGAVVR
jgi:hypothetical protein